MSQRARVVLAGAGLVGLVLLASVLVRLDTRLSHQAAANRRTLGATGQIVTVNREMSARLDQVGALTDQVKATLSATSSLTPLLDQLQRALAGMTTTVGRAGGSATATQASLADINAAVKGLQAKATEMATASAGIPTQESAIVDVLRTMVADLQASLASVRQVRQLLAPGPPA